MRQVRATPYCVFKLKMCKDWLFNALQSGLSECGRICHLKLALPFPPLPTPILLCHLIGWLGVGDKGDGGVVDEGEKVNEQISAVVKLLVNCSRDCLPIQQHISNFKSRFHDRHLKVLCVESKHCWRVWKNAGKPPFGSLYEQKNRARNNVRKHLNLCRAKAEHSKLQKMDKQFPFKCSLVLLSFGDRLISLETGANSPSE